MRALILSGAFGAHCCSSDWIMRVAIGAGLMVLTRMLCGAPSSAAVFISPTTACLEAM